MCNDTFRPPTENWLSLYVRGLYLSGTSEGAGGIGGLLARSSGYQTNGSWTSHAFYHAYGGGNVTFLSPSTYSGTMTRYSYDAYGRTTSLNGPLATANVYRFSSKELHAASGHYYYGYRFYDPQAEFDTYDGVSLPTQGVTIELEDTSNFVGSWSLGLQVAPKKGPNGVELPPFSRRARVPVLPEEVPPCNSAGGAVVLGHELGHLLGLSDEDELIGLGVVTLVENNIRAQLKLPLRPSNHGIPISQFPGFPTTEVYGFFEAWMRSY
jgi:RHS repeat-associated protein